MFLFKESTLLLIISIGFASSAPMTLLERLKEKKGWFSENGDMCKTNPKQIRCFNLRSGHVESILQRAGDINEHVNLTKKLKVVFHAKEEGVDVCGKTTDLKAVSHFELPEDGSPLNRPAEDYRNQPNVSWNAEKGVYYTLIHFDVSALKVRGWWKNVIKQSDKTLKGQINIRYSPPANPTPNLSPIIIILLRQNSNDDGYRDYDVDKWYKSCVVMSPSDNDAEDCRYDFMRFLRELTVVGLQLYYTNGESLYEKYRACTESLPCHEECIQKFATYSPDITFITVDKSQLDHYVNVHFYSLRSYFHSDLPSRADTDSNEDLFTLVPGGMNPGGMRPFSMGPGGMGPAPMAPATMAPENKVPETTSPMRYVDVRARPGDNMEVRNSDTRANSNRQSVKMNLEIGIPYKYFQDDTQLTYSVLIVDQDAPYMWSKPYGHYYKANLKLQGILKNTAGIEFQAFVDFTPPNGTHRYHILLFSQNTNATENVLGNYNDGWDISLLTSTHKLRAVSWMLVKRHDNITCPPAGYGGCMRPQPCTSEYVGVMEDVNARTTIITVRPGGSPPMGTGKDMQASSTRHPVPEGNNTTNKSAAPGGVGSVMNSTASSVSRGSPPARPAFESVYIFVLHVMISLLL